MGKQILVPAILAGIIVIIVAAGFAYGYSSSSSINSNIKISDVKLGAVAPIPNTEGMVMYVSALMKNNGDSVALLKNIKYNVLVDGKNVGTYTEQVAAIPPKGTKNITMKIRITDKDALNTLVNDIQKGSMNLGVKASWTLPAGWYGAAEFAAIPGSSSATKNVNLGPILGGNNTGKHLLQAQVFPVSIYKAGWKVNGQDVDEVKDGTVVDAYVTFTLNQDVNNYNVRICVMHDIRAGIDTHTMCSTFSLSGKKGQQETISIPFTAEHHWYARGYYIVVGTPKLSSSEKMSQVLYEMSNHYPPRLKVNS